MKVRVTWELEVDVSNYDPKHVDILALAHDLTQTELAHQIMYGELNLDELEYSVVV